MRIRKSCINNSPSSSSSSSSSAAASSSSSHSSITAHSFASPTVSSNSSSSSSPISFSPTRCEGLNLLVKAIHHVTAGSVVGVPYVQRRVVRRRRRALRFTNSVLVTELLVEEETEKGEGQLEESDLVAASKSRQRRMMALPLKYQDSVLQPWKTRSRWQRSIKIATEYTGS